MPDSNERYWTYWVSVVMKCPHGHFIYDVQVDNNNVVTIPAKCGGDCMKAGLKLTKRRSVYVYSKE